MNYKEKMEAKDMKYKGMINGYSLKIALGLVFVLFVSLAFAAQGSADNDPLAIYSPDFIMQHQRELGLTDEQKKAMKNEMLSKSARFNELQWDMQEAGETFQNSLLKENPVDEKKANEQLDRVLNIEREVKHLQITLIIRIKNLLTDEQRAKLQSLKK